MDTSDYVKTEPFECLSFKEEPLDNMKMEFSDPEFIYEDEIEIKEEIIDFEETPDVIPLQEVYFASAVKDENMCSENEFSIGFDPLQTDIHVEVALVRSKENVVKSKENFIAPKENVVKSKEVEKFVRCVPPEVLCNVPPDSILRNSLKRKSNLSTDNPVDSCSVTTNNQISVCNKSLSHTDIEGLCLSSDNISRNGLKRKSSSVSADNNINTSSVHSNNQISTNNQISSSSKSVNFNNNVDKQQIRGKKCNSKKLDVLNTDLNSLEKRDIIDEIVSLVKQNNSERLENEVPNDEILQYFYDCSQCELSFVNETILKSHVAEKHRNSAEHLCNLCGQLFSQFEDLNEHLQNHGPKHLCVTCGILFDNGGALSDHEVINHHDHSYLYYSTPVSKSVIAYERRRTCNACDQTFTSSELKNHLGLNNMYSCGTCSKSFHWLDLLNKHYKEKHHLLPSFKCTICDASFFLKDELKTHQNICTESHFTCPLCRKIFNLEEELNQHIISEHKYVCLKCKKSFECAETLNEHEENDDCFKCYICGLSFATQICLKIHNHVEHEILHRCNICNEQFDRKESLNRHKKTHEHALNCNICGENFKFLDELNQHKEIHCFESSSDYQIIQRLETYNFSQNIFVCGICDRSYTLERNLVRHMQSHLYLCDKCGESFYSEVEFLNHMETHNFSANGELSEFELCPKEFSDVIEIYSDS